jgi:glycosyltransferase involved in cell wall biosynthesis
MEENRKSVLIVVQNLPVPFDRRVWKEATTLCRAGYHVAVICPKKGIYQAGRERLEDIDIYRYPLIIEAREAAWEFAAEFLWCWLCTVALSVVAYLHRPFRLIHACNPPDTYFALALLYRVFGVKFIFDHHDLSPEMYLAKGKSAGSFLYRALLWLERATFKTAAGVIAPNQSHLDIALKRGGVALEKTAIVRSGPSRDWTGRRVEPMVELREGFRYMVVYLGEMCAQDGVDIFLESVNVIKQSGGRDVVFVLVGGGPEQDRMKKLAVTLGIMDVVRFTGRIPDEDLWKYLSTADLCVDPDPPSDWSNQSTMNKIIEYMAFGRPIVCFELTENRRTALDAAQYVPLATPAGLAKGIESLLADPVRRAEMSRYGLERFASSLCWENSAPNLLELYDRVLEG